MREIKFRAWDKSAQRMTTGLELKAGSEVGIGENSVIMQYTGLKDKNGIDVYEADFISFMYDHGEGLKPEIGVVPDITEISDFVNMVSDGSWEIIGNIYENPELLKDLMKPKTYICKKCGNQTFTKYSICPKCGEPK